MAVTLEVTGNGGFAGANTNLSEYNVSEEATPLNPSDGSGGVGQMSFGVVDQYDPDGSTPTLALLNNTVRLRDGSQGTTVGKVTELGGNGGVATVTANSRLGLLLATRHADPLQGTAETIFRYYLSLVGITDNIVFEPGDITGPVPAFQESMTGILAVPGWDGVVWDYLRMWAQSIGGEVSLVGDNVVFRAIRKREAVTYRNTDESWSLTTGDMARNIEINYYQNRWYDDALIYPQGGWNSDVQVYQVEPGETQVVNIPVNFSLSSVQQPECIELVSRNNNGNVYSVTGADGLAIKPAQWLQNGGSVTVAVGKDLQSIDITIVGATTTQGPFRIAAGAGASDAYSSLRIHGAGVGFETKTLRIPTGADPSLTAEEVGVTVENPFIRTLTQAYNLGVRTAAAYSGFSQTININTLGINRMGKSGQPAYPSFDQFNDAYLTAGSTFDDFNVQWTGKTFDDFNATYYGLVKNSFANQAFGNVAGARVHYRDAYYRIDTARIGPDALSYAASADTTFYDFNKVWAKDPLTGATPTFNDFNAMMGTKTFGEFSAMPLWYYKPKADGTNFMTP